MEDPITAQCPWCGESFITFFDPSAGEQSYIEDCQICCRPIEMSFRQTMSGDVECWCERS